MRERLERGLKAQGISKRDLAKVLGVHSSIITAMLSGRRSGRKHYESIAKTLKCEVEWLVNGTGPAPTWANPGAATIAGQTSQPDDDLRRTVEKMQEDLSELRGRLQDQSALIALLMRALPSAVPLRAAETESPYIKPEDQESPTKSAYARRHQAVKQPESAGPPRSPGALP